MKPRFFFAGILSVVLCSFVLSSLKPTSRVRTAINEPSDIMVLDNGDYLVPGDKAFVYELNASGSIINSYDFNAFDIEGITSDEKYIYLSEETYQRIIIVDKSTMKMVGQVPFHHNGGRNEGVESIAHITNTNTFILATEKDPQIFFICDNHFQVLKEFQIAGISEVSGMCYNGEKLYVLSDEAHTIFQIDLASFTIEKQWSINVINAEGLIVKGSTATVVSDDMASIFQFNLN